MVLILSIIAGLINAAGQLQYIYYLVNKKIILNKATWGISAAMMGLQAGSYYQVVKTGNPWIATSSIIVAISFLFIFLYSFIYSRYAKLTSSDKVSLGVGLVTVILWRITGDAKIANVILTSAVIISFIPTIIGLFRGRLREKPLPWFIGPFSYLFVVASIFLQSGFSNPVAFAYPLIVGIFMNSFIGFQAIAQDRGYLRVPNSTKK